MSHASENHGHAMLVGCGDHFFVLNRAARLYDRLRARFRRSVHPVTKWIED